MTTGRELVDVIGYDKKTGEGWQCKCPAHDDGKASLSVMDLDDLVLHCHANCSFEDILAAAHALGLPKLQRKQQEPTKYNYYSEEGKYAYTKVRTPDKDFWIESNGRKGLGNAPRVLYRLQEARDAINKGRRVFVVEGEKDCDTAHSRGLCAVSSYTGAGTNWPQEYAHQLRGAHIVIIPDNDKPGYAHAEMVAKTLRDTAKSIKVLKFPDMPDGGDLTDWFSMGGTIEQLKAAVLGDAEEIKAPDLRQTAAEMMGVDVDLTPKLVGEWFPVSSLGLIHAKTGTGKTLFALKLACCLVEGVDFLSYKVTKPVKVLYVDGENGAGLVTERLRWMSKGMNNATFDNLKIFHVGKMEDGEMSNLADEEQQRLVYQPMFDEADVIILDNENALCVSMTGLSGSAAENEILSSTMPFLKKQKQRGKAVILVHHSRKSVNETGNVEQMGSSKRVHPLDYSIALQAMPGMESGFEIFFDKCRPCKAPKKEFCAFTVSDLDGFKMFAKDVDLINVARVKDAYRVLGKWPDVYSALDLSKGYVDRLRLDYIEEQVRKEDDAKYWEDAYNAGPVDDLF